MRFASVTVLAALSSLDSVIASLPENANIPIVPREGVHIETVRRGDFVRRLEAFGAVRLTALSIEAVLEVNAAGVQDLMVGQAALVDVRQGPLQGTVSRIVPTGARGEYLVAVALLNPPPGLQRDQPAAVSIRTEDVNDILWVGRSGRMSSGRTVSWFRLEPGSEYASRVPVRIGKTSARQAEIWSGLEEGDRVITTSVDVPESTSRNLLR